MAKQEVSGADLPTQALALFLYENELIKDKLSPLEVRQFTNGYSNLTYLLRVEGRELVLRRPPAGAIKRGHDMAREYKVLSHLSPHFSKAPKTYAYEATGDILGVPFYLMENIDGVVITYKEAARRGLTASDFKVISTSWLDTFVAFHSLDYKAVGLGDLGKPEGYVERQVTNWGKQYLKAATQDLPAATKVTRWMLDHQPKVYAHTLIHNDFKYDNLVYAEDNWSQINAILDWEMCTLGDPLMDLGTSLGYWVMESDGPVFGQTIPSPTIFPGNPSRSELVQAYATKSGRDVDNLVFYYVFGLFKIAVIVQQIYYRYTKGLTQNPKFSNLDQVCAFLCETAQQAIERKRIE